MGINQVESTVHIKSRKISIFAGGISPSMHDFCSILFKNYVLNLEDGFVRAWREARIRVLSVSLGDLPLDTDVELQQAGQYYEKGQPS